MVKSRYNINKEDDQKTAEALNNLTVWLIFAVTVINVFVSAFGIDNPTVPVHRTSPVWERDATHLNISSSGSWS